MVLKWGIMGVLFLIIAILRINFFLLRSEKTEDETFQEKHLQCKCTRDSH